MPKKALNKKQIEEIKQLLLESKRQLEDNLYKLGEEHSSLNSMDLNDEADFAAASRDYATDIYIKKQQLDELKQVNSSLLKIERGTFDGLCEMCDAEITMKRLRVKPHAKYCIDCREYIDKK